MEGKVVMDFPANGWKNKQGTSSRTCSCGSWEIHWMKTTEQPWPFICSVSDCFNPATVGAHMINKNVPGEYIIPACDSCNHRTDEFNLSVGTTLVSANKQKTCE